MGEASYARLTHLLARDWQLRSQAASMPQHTLAGIGGATKAVTAALVPVGVCGVPGLLSVAVIPGEIPPLLPLPLLQSLQCIIDLPRMQLCSGEKESALISLPSGHAAVEITDGLEFFRECVPTAPEYEASHFSDEHGQLLMSLWEKYKLDGRNVQS
eukprot:6472230-Amphidinium_carterae.1